MAAIQARGTAVNSPHRQRGIALITAILIVSLAVIAATAILSAGSMSIQRTSTLQETEKAWWYATGVEAWVKGILQRDARMNKLDALSDIWAQPVAGLPIENGFLAGQISDMQGRFNLNNFGFADAAGQDSEAAFKKWQTVFIRLFEQLEIEPALARPISEAIKDWVDRDQNPTPYDGAEDNEYLGNSRGSGQPPYRTANRPMMSVTELMAVKGVTPEIYRALLPYVSALPLRTTINVNTAPEPVLRALAAQPSPSLEEFIRSRAEKPIENIGELTNSGALTGNDVDIGMLGTGSQFFQLRADANIGNSHVAIYSLYYRPQAGAPLVLMRSTDSE